MTGELGPVSLMSQVNIIIFNANIGCDKVTEEVKALTDDDGGLFVPSIIKMRDLGEVNNESFFDEPVDISSDDGNKKMKVLPI